MIVKVTQKHINDAKILINETTTLPAKCCPIALALDQKYYVGIAGLCKTKYNLYNSIFDIPFSKKVILFIDRFDHGNPVKPFQFTIEL